MTTTPSPAATSELLSALDAWLLEGYDPARSAAWVGAAPGGGGTATGPDGPPVGCVPASHPPCLHAPGDDRYFQAAGFEVRPVTGRGAATMVSAFCAAHHYLVGAGMAGDRWGLFTPAGALVGIAVLAPCSNPRTAAGMRADTSDEDAQLTAAARAHAWFGERGYRDVVRFCVAPMTPDGTTLGTNTESFFYAGILRGLLARNRDRWRAVRWAEKLTSASGSPTPFPALPAWARALLDDGQEFVKAVRSFSDMGVGHVGTIYQAAGALYAGTTRVETAWVGRRSGQPINRRALSKLRGAGHGHVHQVLRAVWEGGVGTAMARDAATGEYLTTISLGTIATLVPDGLAPAVRSKALLKAWASLAADTEARLAGDPSHPAGRRVDWVLSATLEGYTTQQSAPKHRYLHWITPRPSVARALSRRCRYLRTPILEAERAWRLATPRWGRGIGFNRPRAPEGLGRRPYPH